ncbi:MAG: glutamate formiminotransferase [Candidatus Margulisiibacteriota bacterium]
MKIIECVPNISEGKDLALINKLASVIASVPQVKLLDYSSDPDHNRSVFTFLGLPEAVSEAAFRLSKAAAELLDINCHNGIHPRTGIIDVVPFIPVYNADIEDCIEASRLLGVRLEAELGLPVYYYGEGIKKNVELGIQNEELKSKILNPKSKTGIQSPPLRGFRGLSTPEPTNIFPALPEVRRHIARNNLKGHPTAGAVIVGARYFMAAYNVNLATDNLDIARRIASKIRETNGGLPHVRALGFELKSKGIVQVSMNLIKPEITTPEDVLSAIKKEAAIEGVEVLGDEVIGLLPEEVLKAAASFDGHSLPC